MGFFKKIFKGIGKVFKKIGKGIKSAFKKFGKFMGKIGVLGQVAMMFILPGVGQLLGKAWSAIAGQTATQATASAAGQAAASAAAEAGSSAAQATAQGVAKEAATKAAIDAGTQVATKKATGLMAGGKLARGVGKVMQFTGKVVGTPGKVFSSITQGVTDTLGNFAKTASNNIFGTNFTTAAGDTLSGKFFSGGDSAFGRSFGKTSKFQNILTKAPTAQTLEAVDNYTSTLDSLAKLPQSSLNTEGLPSNMSPSQSPMKQLQDSTFGKNQPDYSSGRDFALEVNRPDGGFVKRDLSQPVSVDGGKSLIANKYPDSQAALNTRVNPYDDPKFNFNANDPTLLADASGTVVEKGADSLLASPVEKESILSRLGDVVGDTVGGIKKSPSDIMDRVENFTADPVGKTGEFLFGGTKEAVRQGVNNQLLQGIGLVEKPVAPVYETTNTYVAPFETTTPQMFEAPETMSPMAFAQNVTNNPSPYGYTAFQYNQYMNRTAAA
tara:strand:+ start:2083 stop:3567 length:1485 start_codon:yes stop_codon:yes gene_type:complete